MADEDLNSLIKFLAKNGMAEFEHEESGKKFSVKIKCKTQKPKEVREEIKAEKAEQKPIEEKVQEQIPKISETYILKSIYVGYFHILGGKEGEGIEQFVKVGDRVNLETTLGILECMKGQVQHEIKLQNYKDFQADYGIIEKILAENGMPVDYGRPLFEIKSCFE